MRKEEEQGRWTGFEGKEEIKIEINRMDERKDEKRMGGQSRG